jgi:hypothetical protein
VNYFVVNFGAGAACRVFVCESYADSNEPGYGLRRMLRSVRLYDQPQGAYIVPC